MPSLTIQRFILLQNTVFHDIVQLSAAMNKKEK